MPDKCVLGRDGLHTSEILLQREGAVFECLALAHIAATFSHRCKNATVMFNISQMLILPQSHVKCRCLHFPASRVHCFTCQTRSKLIAWFADVDHRAFLHVWGGALLQPCDYSFSVLLAGIVSPFHRSLTYRSLSSGSVRSAALSPWHSCWQKAR